MCRQRPPRAQTPSPLARPHVHAPPTRRSPLQTLPDLYAALHDVLSKHSLEERVAMFHGNAVRVYGMDKVTTAA